MGGLKQNLKQRLKNSIKTMIKAKFLIVLSAFIFIAFVLIPSFDLTIELWDGEYREGDIQSTPYAAYTYTSTAKMTESGIELGMTAKELWDTMKAGGNNISQFLKDYSQLERLMNAEIITQFPKIPEGNVKKGNLNGIIEFERHDENGSTYILEFKNKEEFDKLVEAGNSEALKYFALDSDQNVIVAKWEQIDYTFTTNDSEANTKDYSDIEFTNTETSKDGETKRTRTDYTLTTETIHYRAAVQNYVMPFDYLWAMLVASNNKDFALSLVDLVDNSQIKIGIYDTLITVVNTKAYNYEKENRIETAVSLPLGLDIICGVDVWPKSRYWGIPSNPAYDVGRPADYYEDGVQYNVENKVETQTDCLDIKVILADIWVVKYVQEFTYTTPDDVTDPSEPQDLENTDYKLSSDSTIREVSIKHRDEFTAEVIEYVQSNRHDPNPIDYYGNVLPRPDPVVTPVVSVINSYREINRKQTNTVTTKSKGYQTSPPTVEEKTSKTSKEDNFVTLLLKNTSARSKIFGGPSWLFWTIEHNQSTTHMLDLTKYLLNAVLGKAEFSHADIDFSNLFAPSEYTAISNYGGGEGITYGTLDIKESDRDILYRISYAERTGGTPEQIGYIAAVVLNRVLSSSYPNTVHGVVFQKNQFSPVSDGRYYSVVPTEAAKAAVDSVVDNGDTTGGAVNFMTPAASKKPNQQKWLKNCIFLFNDEDDSYRYSDSGEDDKLPRTHNFYTNQSALNELAQYATTTPDSGSSALDTSSSNSFLDIAKECHDYLSNNQYWYPSKDNIEYGGHKNDKGGPVAHKFPVEGEPENQRYVDCSAYVSWVLKKAGYALNSPIKSDDFLNNPLGLEEVEISKVQPGDILVRSGHVEIFIGGGKSYSCGSTNRIKAKSSNCDPNKFTKAFRARKLK